MALINKTGIIDGGLIQAEHVTRVIDALSGVSEDSIVATGSFSGSLTGALTGTASFAETASFTSTASFINTLNQDVILTGSLQLTGSMTHGSSSVANGLNSYAHGLSVTARGDYSRAEGRETNTGITGAYSASVNSNFSTFSSFTMSAAYSNIAYQFSTGDNLYMYGPDNDIAQILPVSRSYYVNPNTIIETNDPAFSTGRHFIVNISIGLLNNLGDQIIPGNYSHAEGHNTTALRNSHAEGYATEAYGYASHTEGYLTQAYGNYSHAEGEGTIALDNYSHAEGFQTVAEGYTSHAEGYITRASSDYSHAEGGLTITYGYASHAEGYNTLTVGDYSHAEGRETRAESYASHTEGYNTTASANYSHAEGYQSVAGGYASHAEGVKNKTITNLAYSASLVSGSGTQPRIKVTLSSSYGNIASRFTNSPSSSLYICSPQPANISTITIPISRSYFQSPNTIIESDDSANRFYSFVSVATQLTGSVLIGNGGDRVTNWGGDQIIAGGYAHSEGAFNDAIGYSSHAEGENCSAIGLNSHAEGIGTNSAAAGSHTEGYLTRTFGVSSHAEGQNTTALGDSSHAEGIGTQANGIGSHAEGIGTIANYNFMHATGRFNVTGSSEEYAYFVVGNGSSNSIRANAFRVSGSGQCLAAGTFTNGGADYAEYFESYNAQPIPLGTVVELTGSLIKICENAENAIGVISNKPSILGNSDEGTADEWVGKYEKDIWGNYIMESYEYELVDGISDQGTPLFKTEIGTRRKLSANFDETATYVPRSERPEWNVVGLLGQIKVLKNQQIPARWIKMKDINEDIAIYLVR